MDLKFTVSVKIQKPIAEVFDAVQNPNKLTRYFTTASASGPLIEGAKVNWRFADYPEDVEVHVGRVVPNERIEFEWSAADGDYKTKVEMTFQSLNEENTLVTISEGTWKETPAGLKASYDNCQGWTQMSCCLKAFVERGINLREGFY